MNDQVGNDSKTEPRRPWAPLELKVLDVPNNTNNGNGRLQPGEGINFYRNS